MPFHRDYNINRAVSDFHNYRKRFKVEVDNPADWGIAASGGYGMSTAQRAIWDSWAAWVEEQTITPDQDPEEPYFYHKNVLILHRNWLERALDANMWETVTHEDRILAYEYEVERKHLRNMLGGLESYFHDDTVPDPYNDDVLLPSLTEFLKDMHRIAFETKEAVHEGTGVVWVSWDDEDFVRALIDVVPIKVIWANLYNSISEEVPYCVNWSLVPRRIYLDDALRTRIISAVIRSQKPAVKFRDRLTIDGEEITFLEDDIELAYCQLGWVRDDYAEYARGYPQWVTAYTTIPQNPDKVVVIPRNRARFSYPDFYTVSAYETIQKRLF